MLMMTKVSIARFTVCTGESWYTQMTTTTLQKTSRREAREGYVRYLLAVNEFNELDSEKYLTTPQAELDGKSILELIYSGDYELAVSVVERLIEDCEIEEDELENIE